MDDLPASVDMTAYLMDGRAFRIYKNNLQHLAYGKCNAPTAFKDALVVDDIVLAIRLLETEQEAVTQSGPGFEHVKEPLAMGFSPAEIVRLIIDKGKDPSWLEQSDKASSVRISEEVRELMRAEQSNTSRESLASIQISHSLPSQRETDWEETPVISPYFHFQ